MPTFWICWDCKKFFDYLSAATAHKRKNPGHVIEAVDCEHLGFLKLPDQSPIPARGDVYE